MDSTLDSFFDNFNGEMEEHRLDKLRKDSLLVKISDILMKYLSKDSLKISKKARKFQNPYLYYRIDIENTVSIHTVADSLIASFNKIYTSLHSEVDDTVYYLSFNVFNIIEDGELEDQLLIKIIPSRSGTVAIEIIIINDLTVIQYTKTEYGYEVIYLEDEELQEWSFFPLGNGEYECGNILFTPNDKSSSPFDSLIYKEQ